MKMIVITFLTIMLAILPVAKQADKQNESEDPYDISSVRTLISVAQAAHHISVGSFEKHNNAMGDSAAIAIMKIYSEDELTQPTNVRAYLSEIRAAFEFPNLIVRKDDRDPKATILLLRYLKENLADISLKKEVADLAVHLSKLQPPMAQPVH